MEAEDGPSARVLAIHTGDVDGVPGSEHSHGPVLAIEDLEGSEAEDGPSLDHITVFCVLCHLSLSLLLCLLDKHILNKQQKTKR